MKNTLAIVRYTSKLISAALSLFGIADLMYSAIASYGFNVPAFLNTNIWGKSLMDSFPTWDLFIIGILMMIILSGKIQWWSLGCPIAAALLIVIWESVSGIPLLSHLLIGMYFAIVFLYCFPSFQRYFEFSSGY